MLLRRLTITLSAAALIAIAATGVNSASSAASDQGTGAAAQGRQGGAAPAAPQGGGGFVPAPARRAGEGLGPFKTMMIRGVMLIDGTGAPPPRPGRHRRRRQPHHARSRSAGTPGLSLAAEARPPQDADHEIDATGMYLHAGLRRHARARRRAAEERRGRVRLQALAGPRRHHRARRAARGQRHLGAARRSAARRTRSWRRASSTTSGRQRLGQGPVDTPEQARAWVQWARDQRRRRPEARRARARRSWRRCSTRRKKHGLGSTAHLAAERRRADERHQGRAPRPRHGHALLRPLRVAAQGLRRPAVAGRHERQRRAVALRPGRAPLGQDPRARQPRVEGVPRRST